MSHAERAHARLSPSFMNIALNCALSVVLKEKVGPQERTKDSDLGTLKHEAAEKCLRELLDQKVRGPGVDYRINAFSIDSSVQEVNKVAQAWRDVVWKEVFEQTVTGKAWALEDRLVYSEKYDIWGTADLWLCATDDRAKRFVHIADLKSGRIEVDIDGDYQLPTYAVAFRQELRAMGKDIDYAIVSIYQPLSETPWKTRKLTGKQLDKHEAKLQKLIIDVYGDKTPRAKIGKQCLHCPGQDLCMEYDKKMKAETALAFVDPKDFSFPDVDVLPDSALVKIVLNQKALTKFMESARKRLFNKMFNGEIIPDVKFVEGRASRYIDPDRIALKADVLRKHNITPYKESPKGRTELTNELTPIVGVKEAKELVDSMSTDVKKGVLLVSAGDKRPAIDRSPTEMFDDGDD